MADSPRRFDIIGAGPAGLYTAILLRRRLPDVQVCVTEQNPRGATFGFGVVFSDQALDFLNADDPQTHDLVTPHMERWRNMTLNHPRGSVTLDGVGFSAIGRRELNEILLERALALGAEVRFDTPVKDPGTLASDLVIGADGLNSVVRRANESAYAPGIEHFENHFAWFGAQVPFETLTQTFIETERGPLNAHHYRYAPGRSTFIVECDDAVFRAYGFAGMDEAQSARLCGELFAGVLCGTGLVTNKSNWRRFPRLWCERWVAGRHVILGDAAHTAHFSIGSGTRLAMEDAIALVHALAEHADIDAALAAFERERQPIAAKIVAAANTSAQWYETFGEKMRLEPLAFAYNYITRSGRIDDARLRRLAPQFMQAYEASRRAKEPQASPGAADTADGDGDRASHGARLPAAPAIVDPVPDDAPGAVEIGFSRAAHANCSAILWDNLQRNPDRIAVTGPAGTLTYRQLIAEASHWGHAFREHGLAPGERIAFFLDDGPAYPAAFFGAVRAGFVPVLLNIQTPADVLAYFLRDSAARLVLADTSLATVFTAGVLAETAVEKIVLTQEAGAREAPPSGDGAGGGAGDPGAVTGNRGAPAQQGPARVTAAAFTAGRPDTLEAAATGPDDMAFWMYSSGSTGRPKGIVHLHHDMAYTQASFGRHVLKLEADDVCFSVPKIYFAYGFGNAFTFPFSVGAATVLMPGQPRPDAVLDTIERYRPTVLFGLPTLYTALARAPGVERRDLSSLRQSMSAAETLSEEIYNAWKRLAGHGPTEGLGSTEVLHIYLSNRLDDQRPGAAGTPVPGYEIRLMDNDGRPTAPGGEGVMWVRGHSSAPCYWNRPDKTAETMRADWIYTGDRFVERDGAFYFQGRADDLIKVSGQWVWPLEVERCLNEHPEVHECAVLAHRLPDQRMALRAVVCLAGARTGDDAQTGRLRDFVKQRLAPYKAPRFVEYVDELPKTGTGKIDRQALR